MAFQGTASINVPATNQEAAMVSVSRVYSLIDSKGRVCLRHADRKLLEFWAYQWSMTVYSIV